MRDNEIPFDNEEYKTNLTLQEAIELLNDCGTNINSQQEPTVLELLNKALERNVVKKPKHIRGLTYECNNCKNSLPQVGNNYCPNCGQRLDWDNAND